MSRFKASSASPEAPTSIETGVAKVSTERESVRIAMKVAVYIL